MASRPSPKMIWTQDDFESMGWHDSALHAVAVESALPFPGRVLLDIDYIIEWVHPEESGGSLRFWICPATLVFDEAADFKSEIDLTGHAFELSLNEVVRSRADDRGRREWLLNGHEFTISLVSSGFTQYLRAAPILSDHQRLTRGERGDASFTLGV